MNKLAGGPAPIEKSDGSRRALFRWLHAVRCDLAIISAIGIAFVLLAQRPVPLTGDGGEYLAMYFSWTSTLRPYLTAHAWQQFNDFFQAQGMAGWGSHDIWLHRPELQVGDTGDFNHFWFYSAMAALVGSFLRPLGVTSPITAFLTLHALLLTAPALLAWRYFARSGLLAVLVLTVLSPMFWLVDRVHTELLTYSMTIAAVILFRAGQRLFAAIALAVASTQNPSFALVAITVVAIDLSIHRLAQRRVRDYAVMVTCLVLIALHPLYYLARFGHLTPQSITHAVADHADPRTILLWFFDPDVGLFANWPLGVFVVALAALALYTRRGARSAVVPRGWWLFVASYLAFSLYAQSRAINLDSGATQSVARYALWYLALFFPMLESVFALAFLDRRFASGLGLVLIGGSTFSFVYDQPFRPEPAFRAPTLLSRFTQKRIPRLYDAPAEIFAERYSGVGETPILGTALLVIGPDCRKLLIFDRPDAERVLPRAACGFSESAVVEMGRRVALSLQRDELRATEHGVFQKPSPILGDEYSTDELYPYRATYIHLSDADVDRLTFRSHVDTWYSTARGADAPQVLESRWFDPEDWGTWSRNVDARLAIPCVTGLHRAKLQIELRRPGVGESPLTVVARIADRFPAHAEFVLAGDLPQIVELALDSDACRDGSVKIFVTASRFTRIPATAGKGRERMVGVGISRFRFLPAGSP